MRLRKKKVSKSQEKKKKKGEIAKIGNSTYKKKIVTLVAKGSCLIGALFHVNSDDNTGEFDPYFIERIKNCLHLMIEKEFIG